MLIHVLWQLASLRSANPTSSFNLLNLPISFSIELRSSLTNDVFEEHFSLIQTK